MSAAGGLRLDVALVERGMCASRNRALREIAAGRVRVNGAAAAKAAQRVSTADSIELLESDPWVARSAHKLLGALEDLGMPELPAHKVCLDAGASTGGFTQVLLERGAVHVHAVDVGHDQLAAQLRSDPRVTDLSGCNLRDLTPEHLGGCSIELITADVSFISLRLLIEPLLSVTGPGADLLLMVKPQFELSRGRLDKHGVVTRAGDRADAVASVIESVHAAGAAVQAWTPSQLPGPSGNREYFLHVRQCPPVGSNAAQPLPAALIEDVRSRISQEAA